jgi:hypothetical protein
MKDFWSYFGQGLAWASLILSIGGCNYFVAKAHYVDAQAEQLQSQHSSK